MLRYFVNKKTDEARVLMETEISQVKPGFPPKKREIFLVAKVAKDYCSLKLWSGSLLATTDSWNMEEIKPSYSQKAYLLCKVARSLSVFNGMVEGAVFHSFAESLTRELENAHAEMISQLGIEGVVAFKKRFVDLADSNSSITRGPVEMSNGKRGDIDEER